MKNIPYCVAFLFLLAVLPSCVSRQAETISDGGAYSQSMALDAAIEEIAAYFIRNLAPQSGIALVNFEAETQAASDYIFEEMWIYFEDNSSLLLVERQKLDLIHRELNYQASGQVSDVSAKSIGQQFGPQTLLYGKLSRLGGEYRLVVYATDVELATSKMRAAAIKPDSHLAALLETKNTGKADVDLAMALYAGTGNSFGFTIQTDRANGDYHDGDTMTVQIYSEHDAWFKVTHVDVNGNVQVIYPTVPADNNFIRAGETRLIPDATRFRMTKPYGTEMILAAAYSVPFAAAAQNGVRSTPPLSGAMLVRGLVVEHVETRADIRPEATARFTYTISP